MVDSEVHITTKRPPAPPQDADFAIYIDFKKGVGDPQRVFKVAEGIISSFQRLDKALCTSIDNDIQPLLVLEEIESGSLKIWLKNILSKIDNQALKELDWKPAVGKYLVKAKYIYIDWTNKSSQNEPTLGDLSEKLKIIAQETDIKHLPDYAPPSLQELAAVTKELDAVKSDLIEGDELKYIPPEGEPIGFDLKISWEDVELENMVIKETTKFENMPMNLIVKKPDYLGTSKWDFRHGKIVIPASIQDENWLKNFQARKFDIRPGDALKCKVTVENSYGYDSELVKESYVVTSVNEILVNQVWRQTDIDEDSNES